MFKFFVSLLSQAPSNTHTDTQYSSLHVLWLMCYVMVLPLAQDTCDLGVKDEVCAGRYWYVRSRASVFGPPGEIERRTDVHRHGVARVFGASKRNVWTLSSECLMGWLRMGRMGSTGFDNLVRLPEECKGVEGENVIKSMLFMERDFGKC